MCTEIHNKVLYSLIFIFQRRLAVKVGKTREQFVGLF